MGVWAVLWLALTRGEQLDRAFALPLAALVRSSLRRVLGLEVSK
jgi:hypothetical protein